MSRFRLESLTFRPLSVPLAEPFVIATARVDATPNVLVEAEVADVRTGARARGLGEAATLPPVTKETQADVLAQLAAVRPPIAIATEAAEGPLAWRGIEDWSRHAPLGTCAAAGLDLAVADALARLAGLPLCDIGRASPAPRRLRSDITLPIGPPEHMARLARAWAAQGFDCFKVKVGRDVESDLRALEAIHVAVPHAAFRVDANGGFTARDARSVADAMLRLGLAVECFEQPCARDDLEGLAEVRRAVPFDVVADESCRGPADVLALAKARAVDGVNLKLAKTGGFAQAVAAGTLARAHGLSLMVGAMVETRLGITAAAHLACLLGGVEYPDLDTAWLLAEDPFEGGYAAEGPDYTLPESAGLGIALRTA